MKRRESTFRDRLGGPTGPAGSQGQPLRLKEWVDDGRREVDQARQMIEHWLDELQHFLEGPGASRDTEARDRAFCEHTRMVVVAGETLHNLTQILVRWGEVEPPESAWDTELAQRTDSLLAQVAATARSSPYEHNCRERLAYVRQRWRAWCPDFEPLASGGSIGRSG